METFLIAGLGNPDKKYEETRHNAGFQAIERLSAKAGIPIRDKRFKGITGSGLFEGKKLLLLKPLTYMNLSGESVAAAAHFYNIPADHVIVLCDDINFACGRMRIRAGGSAGGHNGLKNIIAQLGEDGFPRVRIGVGAKMEQQDLVSHVLGKFAPEDRRLMDEVFETAGEAALCIVQHGVTEAMNRYNGLNLGNEAN
ncbi:MAG: aminoacyl-tRNA hydrolase [Clostridiales bacterium]|jgi:PTH1 family peptidyl-tRNA hydrolase|nr:aminoacyl-tRNA hydrolase [Clostridiales bacterium]